MEFVIIPAILESFLIWWNGCIKRRLIRGDTRQSSIDGVRYAAEDSWWMVAAAVHILDMVTRFHEWLVRSAHQIWRNI